MLKLFLGTRSGTCGSAIWHLVRKSQKPKSTRGRRSVTCSRTKPSSIKKNWDGISNHIRVSFFTIFELTHKLVNLCYFNLLAEIDSTSASYPMWDKERIMSENVEITAWENWRSVSYRVTQLKSFTYYFGSQWTSSTTSMSSSFSAKIHLESELELQRAYC